MASSQVVEGPYTGLEQVEDWLCTTRMPAPDPSRRRAGEERCEECAEKPVRTCKGASLGEGEQVREALAGSHHSRSPAASLVSVTPALVLDPRTVLILAPRVELVTARRR